MAEPVVSALPAAGQPLMDAYLARLHADLPGFVTGVFVHGSIALGAYNPRSSDVDVVTTLSRRATADDIDRLRAIHTRLSQQFPIPPLEVIYLQPGDLGKFGDDIAPHPYAHEGELQAAGHFDENSITWWVLKHKGIAVLGTLPGFEVDWNRLVAETHTNMNVYWARYTREPARIAWLVSDFGVQWAVLGLLRQYYTFAAGGITSKDGAGHYALEHLPACWHKLVQEALNIRQDGFKSAYRGQWLRAYETWRFLRWLIHECNARFAQGTFQAT